MHKWVQFPAALLVLTMLLTGSSTIYAAEREPKPTKAQAERAEQQAERTEQQAERTEQQAERAEQQAEQARQESVQLTEAQRQELSVLYKEIFDKKKAVIAKYVEYGVMSADKADKLVSHMERRLAKLEQQGYIPNWKKCKKDHKDHMEHHHHHDH